MKILALTFGLLSITQFSFSQNCELKKTSKIIIGKTIIQIIEFLKLDSTDYTIVQEPPMVLRGIRGKKDNMDFIIYSERLMQKIEIDTIGGKWNIIPGKTNLQLIKDKKAIGFSIRCGNSIITKGQTISYYDFDWLKTVPH
jgi:hypothetical protein